MKLRNLHLNKTLFKPQSMVQQIRKLQKRHYMYSESFALCCISKKYIAGLKDCSPKTSLLKSCNDLIGHLFLRIIIWIIITFGILGNLVVISLKLREISKKSNVFYLSLSFFDLSFGLYLAIVASVDRHYHGIYIENDYKWKSSILCNFSGIFASTSILSSNVSLLLITIDRYIAFHYPHLEIKPKILLLTNFLSIPLFTTLSIIPIFLFKVSLISITKIVY